MGGLNENLAICHLESLNHRYTTFFDVEKEYGE